MTDTDAPQGLDPFTVLAEACRRLGLKPRESALLRDCDHAWSLVSNGHLLITPGRVPAARRLMERGYLTQTAEQPKPFDPIGFGLFVVMSNENIRKLIEDANATLTNNRSEP